MQNAELADLKLAIGAPGSEVENCNAPCSFARLLICIPCDCRSIHNQQAQPVSASTIACAWLSALTSIWSISFMQSRGLQHCPLSLSMTLLLPVEVFIMQTVHKPPGL